MGAADVLRSRIAPGAMSAGSRESSKTSQDDHDPEAGDDEMVSHDMNTQEKA